MNEIVNYLNQKEYSFEKKFDRFTLRYKSESIYGSLGWIHIDVNEERVGKYSLVIENVYPSCRRSIVCSYGKKYCSVNGYGIGKDILLDKKQLVSKIESALSNYEILRQCKKS